MPAKPKKPGTIRAAQGKLGGAQRAERNAVRARALASDLMEGKDLDDRQNRIGSKRRYGGPALDEEPKDTQQATAPSTPQSDSKDSDV